MTWESSCTSKKAIPRRDTGGPLDDVLGLEIGAEVRISEADYLRFHTAISDYVDEVGERMKARTSEEVERIGQLITSFPEPWQE
jgi:hypothetical protein